MPIAAEQVMIGLYCGPWGGTIDIQVAGAALWPLGLHPDQPTSRIVGPPRPKWWHAEADRSWRRTPDEATPRPRRRPRS
ncbi:hypothetical protein ABZS66_30815 [Dactylosporangium sp. NPDC005572]|uniref:hypothetical protein n=1 Tax=Dactylosporangium sp. NPDC005572 TaxID=3156889 RepID=UPI0033B02CD8